MERIVGINRASYLPPEILSGLQYFCLYAFALVLERQPLTQEQDQFMEHMFRSVSFPLNKAQYLAAVRTKNADYRAMLEIIELTQNRAGKFWLAMFRSLSKTGGTKEAIHKLLCAFSDIVMNFAMLGKPGSTVAGPIVEAAIRAADIQADACKNIAPDDIDMLGQTSYCEHFHKMRRIFKDLVRQGGDELDMDADSGDFYFDYLILNTVIDLTARCGAPTAVKDEMAERVLRDCVYTFPLTAVEYLENRVRDTEFAGLMHSLYFCDGVIAGMFWKVLHMLSVQAERFEDSIRFMQVYTSFLMGAEAKLQQEYPGVDFHRFAQRYTENIAQSMVAELNRA